MSRNTDVANDALQQAAEWFAVLRDGAAGNRQKAAWQAWLGAAEENRVAWHYVQQISRRFEPLQKTADPKRTASSLQDANARLHRRRQVLAGMGVVAGAGVLGWFGAQHTPLPGLLATLGADYRTATGEQRQLTLADGSSVWLNTASAIDVDFSQQLRRLSLRAGEIFIDTAGDAQRPFVVDTDHGRLRALGTRFNVHALGDRSHLAVYEGAVEIRTRSGVTRILGAGEQSAFNVSGIQPPSAADGAHEAWTRGLLVAQDIPLRELVTQLRRYREGHIGVADDIAGLRVYGSFPIRDTDQVLAMLTAALPVEIRHTLPWWISIEPRRD